MTHEDILRTAMQKATDNGWYGVYKNGHTWPDAKTLLGWQWDEETEKLTDAAYEDETTVNVEAIIFSHLFAKSLWGTAKVCYLCGYQPNYYHDSKDQPHIDNIDQYKWHLQQMVLAEDPIAYLGDNL